MAQRGIWRCYCCCRCDWCPVCKSEPSNQNNYMALMATRKRSWQKKKCRTLAHFAVGRQSSGEYGTVYGKLNIQLAKWTFRYHFSPILLESSWIHLTSISIAFLGKYLEIHVTYTLTKNSSYRIKLSSLRRAQGQRILLEFYFVGTSLVYVTNIQCFFFLYTNPSLPNIISTFWFLFLLRPLSAKIKLSRTKSKQPLAMK